MHRGMAKLGRALFAARAATLRSGARIPRHRSAASWSARTARFAAPASMAFRAGSTIHARAPERPRTEVPARVPRRGKRDHARGRHRGVAQGLRRPVTWPPCTRCARSLIQAGIAEIAYPASLEIPDAGARTSDQQRRCWARRAAACAACRWSSAAGNRTTRRAGASLGWAFYDWGNWAFATDRDGGLFPLFFKQYWSAGADVARARGKLGAANSVASLFVALSRRCSARWRIAAAAKKRFFFAFAVFGVVTTGCCARSARATGSRRPALRAGDRGILGRDRLLRQPDRGRGAAGQRPRVGARLRAGLSRRWAAVRAERVVNQPSRLVRARRRRAGGEKPTFLLVAVWWAVFTLPLLLRNVESRAPARAARPRPCAKGSRSSRHTSGAWASLRPVWTFLVAYWLYIDGVDTVVRMAVDYGLSLGLKASALIIALLITQLVGFPAAIACARLSARIGTQRAILLGIALYVGITAWGRSCVPRPSSTCWRSRSGWPRAASRR